MSDAWDGLERRVYPPPPPSGSQESDMRQYLIGQFELLNAKIGALHIDMVGHKAEMQHLHADIEDVKRAFPKTDEGARDYHGHYDHHDGLIKASRRWGEIGTDVTKKLFGGIAWIVVVFVALAIWERIKASIKG